MAWIGALVGFFIGAAMFSIPLGLLMAVLGGFIGYTFFRKDVKVGASSTEAWPGAPSTPNAGRAQTLENQVLVLQQQMQRMQQRMTTLEQQRSGSADAVVPPLSPDTTAGGRISDVALERQAGAVETTEDISHLHAEQHPTGPTPSAPTVDTAHDLPGKAAALLKTGQHDRAASTTAALPASTEEAAVEAERTRDAARESIPSATDTASATSPRATAGTSTRPPAPPATPSFLDKFIQRWVLGGNPLVKIGVLILFLGLAFLLRYAAEHAVLPLEWRYAGVAAMGIGLLLLGWRWRGRTDNYGLILQGAGIGVLYLTTLAAMKLHPLLPVEFGFAILIGVAAFAALLAILQDALALAVVAALGGFAAPVLASTGSGNHIALFSYLTVLNLGIVAIAWFKSWRALNLIGYVCSFALGSAWAAKYYREELFSSTEPFLLLLFVLYVLITFLFARRTLADAPDHSTATFGVQVRQAAARVSYVDGSLAFGVPFSTFWLQYLLMQPVVYGAAFSALGFGLGYIALAFLLFRRTGLRYLLLTETLIALGVVFGSLAIPLLDQPWTAAAWAVEAAGVYWVGSRQQRVHARVFALLLLVGSAITFVPELRWSSTGPVLDGSLLSCVLLAVSTGYTYWLMRRALPGQLHRFETTLRPYVIGFGALFLGAIPLLIFSRTWASPALALLGSALIFAALRLSERPLLHWGWIYQVAAGALFMTTLRAEAGGSVLSNGWTGLLAASLIGAGMLVGVWAIARHALADDKNKTPPAALDARASLALLAGLVFINLAPLFVLPWRFAAMIWPLTGMATLIWAVRARHSGAILFALGLQAIAGMAHVWSRTIGDAGAPELDFVPPFLHSGFWGPALIALAALICARLLQRAARAHAFDIALGWIALGWGGVWWAFAWGDEINRVVPAYNVTASLVAVTLVTAWAWSSLAQRHHWPQLGLATLAFLPVLMLLAAVARLGDTQHPLAAWGALAWPAALLMHGLLLRRQQAWVPPTLLDLAHTVGAWLFVLQAALEVQWRFAQWGNAASAWPLLGWMLVPVIYLWALTRPKVQSCWPLRDHFKPYVMVSAFPLVVYLLGWVWVTNGFSDGSAAPLPYVPLLNPLEIAHLAVLLAATLWWWSLRTQPALRGGAPLATMVLGSTAFAVLTGGVIRACHHWAQIPWQAGALIGSNVVQTSLSIVWSLLAIALMLLGNRRQLRWIWIVGATLVAVVVAKLFLMELSASGSLARIVSFIVVGLLLLLVGYLAPLPPRHTTEPEARVV